MNRYFPGAAAATIVAALTAPVAAPHAAAAPYDITIDQITVDHSRTPKRSIAYNGQTPGPILRFKEGETVTINVTNNLDESTSIHWHGLILPADQDGVPDISFPGIAPGETFTYRFPITQSGTYWYHSHSGMQEQEGAYGAIVIEPTAREPFKVDREHVIVLSDSHEHSAMRTLSVQIESEDGIANAAIAEAAQRIDDLAALASEMAGMLAHDMVRPDGCKACAMKVRLADLGVLV